MYKEQFDKEPQSVQEVFTWTDDDMKFSWENGRCHGGSGGTAQAFINYMKNVYYKNKASKTNTVKEETRLEEFARRQKEFNEIYIGKPQPTKERIGWEDVPIWFRDDTFINNIKSIGKNDGEKYWLPFFIKPIDKNLFKFIPFEIQDKQKIFTQEQVNEIERKAFEAARKYIKKASALKYENHYTEKDFEHKYPTYEDYLNSKNNKK